MEHTIKMWFHKKTSDQSQYTVVCSSLLKKDSISSSTILEQGVSRLFDKRECKQANLHPHQRRVWSQSRLRNSPKPYLVLQQPLHCKQVQPRNTNFSLTQTMQCSHSKQCSVGMILTDCIYSHGVRGRPNGAHLGSLRLKYLRAILSQKEIICMLSWNKKCPLWDRKGSSVR